MINKLQFLFVFLPGLITSFHYPQISLASGFIANADTQMVYKASSVLSTGIPAGRGENNERIIAVKVITEGNLNPVTLDKIKFNLTGSTNLDDFDSVKIWFTAGDPKLITNVLFGTTVVGPGTIEIAGNQLLAEGSNHFWVTGDLVPDAIEGDSIKGGIESVTIDGIEYLVTPGMTNYVCSLPIAA